MRRFAHGPGIVTSRQVTGGESIKELSEYLGHADPGFTLRTYTHLMPTSSERTRKAVDAVFGVAQLREEANE